jgi:glycosyltransferase involved in cell wall biosynthesis
MPAPFFTVVIPAYNRAATLATAIHSVLDQSFQDFEIVVVDDGSNDNPKAVIDAIADPRIRYIAQANRGGGAARNAGIDAAQGRYVAPLDSDDVFLPHHLHTMKALVAEHDNLVGYARILVDRGEGRTFLKPPRALRANENMGEYLLCDRGFVPTITLVVERRIAAKVRYHENLRIAEDTDFAIRLQLAGCRFAMAPEAGAVWKDVPDPNRTSAVGAAASIKGLRLAKWLQAMKPELTHRAWLGARGWAYAKLVAREGHKMTALGYYLAALFQGCYRPRLAGVVFLQIFLSPNAYRTLADQAISRLRMGLRRAPEKHLPATFERA